jgi:hypothetical protein
VCEKSSAYLLHDSATAHTVLVVQTVPSLQGITEIKHTHLLVRFGSGCEVRSESKLEIIFYHQKHPKERDGISYGDNIGGI